jgi:hypothetical protein
MDSACPFPGVAVGIFPLTCKLPLHVVAWIFGSSKGGAYSLISRRDRGKNGNCNGERKNRYRGALLSSGPPSSGSSPVPSHSSRNSRLPSPLQCAQPPTHFQESVHAYSVGRAESGCGRSGPRTLPALQGRRVRGDDLTTQAVARRVSLRAPKPAALQTRQAPRRRSRHVACSPPEEDMDNFSSSLLKRSAHGSGAGHQSLQARGVAILEPQLFVQGCPVLFPIIEIVAFSVTSAKDRHNSSKWACPARSARTSSTCSLATRLDQCFPSYILAWPGNPSTF